MVWHQAVEQALCTNGFSGIFGIWLVHVLTAGMLFLALIAASYFYEMFYPTHPNFEDDHEEMEMVAPDAPRWTPENLAETGDPDYVDVYDKPAAR